LTRFSFKLRGAGFYAELDGFDQLLCYHRHWCATGRSQNIKKGTIICSASNS
jgi:hypothetical protein